MLLLEKSESTQTLEHSRPVRRASNISQALRKLEAEGPRTQAAVAEPELEVRPIHSEAELDEVYRLTYDAYLERSYCEPQPNGRLIHYPHLDHIPETTVLAAVQDNQLIGTNSWTLDGPRGLPNDLDFKPECRQLRQQGRCLGACWRLATRNACRGERTVVMKLIAATVASMVQAGVQTALFTFNPRHERIYQRLLNMRTIARSEGTHGLSNAPAVLMRLDRENIPPMWLKNTGM